MTDLWVHEVIVPKYQEFTPSYNIDLEYVRLYLYKHGAPTGTVRVDIRDANAKVIAQSTNLSVENILTLSDGYIHGMVQFDLRAHLRSGVAYRLYLTPVTYAYSESSYIGWCNGFDYGYGKESYGGSTGASAALHFELWSSKRVNRSTA